MSKHNVVEFTGREKVRDELTELIHDGASKLIAQGLDIEVSELLSALCGRQDEVDRSACAVTTLLSLPVRTSKNA